MTDTTQVPELDRALALHIIERLGSAGIPPTTGLVHINAGNEQLLELLEREYFDVILKRSSAFKLVEAYYGGGKTHFLLILRELAWRRGFACALVELSPVECPYDDPVKVYRAVASRVQLEPKDPLSLDEPTGITTLLRRQAEAEVAAVMEEESAASWGRRGDARRRAVDRLITRLDEAPIESSAYRAAAIAWLEAYAGDDRHTQRLMEAWFLGEDVPVSTVRTHGVHDTVRPANGFTMLRSLVQLIRGLGLAGTALLFDEVDRTLSVSARKHESITDNLRQIIDLCGQQRLPNTFFVYAVPPEFMRNIVVNYPALTQRLAAPVEFGVRNPQSPRIALDQLDMPAQALLEAIGQRILRVYQVARDIQLSAGTQAYNAAALAKACLAREFDVNHRRLFVKTWIACLEGQRVDGETFLGDEAIGTLLGQHAGALHRLAEDAAHSGFGDDDF